MTAASRHRALFHRDAREYLAGVTAFASAALADGRAVLVAVPGHRLGVLRAELGDRVSYADLAVEGRNPGRILAGVVLPFDTRHRDRRVAIVSEPVWPGRDALELDACTIHEALTNVVLAGRDTITLCPYAVGGPDAGARRTHPVVVEAGAERHSEHYDDPLVVAAAFDRELPARPPYATTVKFSQTEDLAAVRATVRDCGPDDLVFAVNELATNSLRYAGGGRVALWTETGRVVCQVDDDGHFADPLAGRVPPPATSTSGRGLLLVNELCDLVRINRRADGTTIRVHLAL